MMPFDWREYLDLARELAGLQGSGYSREASERSAVSRAYYAAFCWARNYAEKNLEFQPEGKPSDHAKLREHLKKKGYPELASGLNKLRGWRNACDYDDQVSQLHQQVSSSIEVADKIIQRCK
jgi:uncharacterized protein (UPF0332 family)